MINLRFIYISFSLLFSISITAQKSAPIDREIVLTFEDSTVVAHILIKKPEIKITYPQVYYWCFKETLGQSQSGYHGNLLNGKYVVYDIKKRLVREGHFLNGLKHGVWKSWYPSGVLKANEIWKNGLQEGDFVNYAPTGKVSQTATYKKGLLTGELVTCEGDSKTVRKFVNGKEKIKKVRVKKEKTTPQKKEKTKKKKKTKVEKVDEIATPQSEVKVE